MKCLPILKKYFIKIIDKVLAVNMFFEREYYKLKIIQEAKSVGEGLSVKGKNIINSNTVLGDNVDLHGLIVNGDGKIFIGNNFHSGPDCLFLTINHNYDYGTKIPYDETFLGQPIKIGDNVWLGWGTTILSGVSIGEGAIIQAGSVVVDDIPCCAIAGGCPAKVFKYRNKEHYYRLKKSKKFY